MFDNRVLVKSEIDYGTQTPELLVSLFRGHVQEVNSVQFFNFGFRQKL